MGMGMGRRKAGVIVERKNKMNRKLVEGQVPRGGWRGKYGSEHSRPSDQILRF